MFSAAAVAVVVVCVCIVENLLSFYVKFLNEAGLCQLAATSPASTLHCFGVLLPSAPLALVFHFHHTPPAQSTVHTPGSIFGRFFLVDCLL